MSTRIPLPGNMIDTLMKGVETGSNFYSRAMNPILQRENLKQQANLDREHQKQLENHFQMNFGLSKQAAGRAALAASDAHKIAMNKLDPTYEAKQYEALENYFRNKSQNQGGLVGSNPSSQQEMMPTEEASQGLGVFNPGGLMDAQQHINENKNKNLPGNVSGPDLQLMKQFPALRGLYKKHFGVDPLAPVPQTPEEKQAAAIDLFKQKEGIKAQNKGGDTPTNAVLTQNQQAIQGIDTVVPMLDELLESKNIPGIMDFSPGKKAAYNAKTSSMIDTLIAAQSLPKVQASIDLVEEQIRRKAGETVNDYKNRLQDLRDDLIKRRSRSKALLENRQVNTGEMPAQEKTLGGVKYRKIDGEWHEVE